MRIWLDDIRNPPDDTWHIVRTSGQAIALYELFIAGGGDQANLEISFDHDLGGEDTARPVVAYMEAITIVNELPMFKWHVHSQNPVGAAYIRRAMERMQQRCEEKALTATKLANIQTGSEFSK